jgi:hypothetical protein
MLPFSGEEVLVRFVPSAVALGLLPMPFETANCGMHIVKILFVVLAFLQPIKCIAGGNIDDASNRLKKSKRGALDCEASNLDKRARLSLEGGPLDNIHGACSLLHWGIIRT